MRNDNRWRFVGLMKIDGERLAGLRSLSVLNHRLPRSRHPGRGVTFKRVACRGAFPWLTWQRSAFYVLAGYIDERRILDDESKVPSVSLGDLLACTFATGLL